MLSACLIRCTRDMAYGLSFHKTSVLWSGCLDMDEDGESSLEGVKKKQASKEEDNCGEKPAAPEVNEGLNLPKTLWTPVQ